MEEIELRTLILRGEDSTLQFKRQVDSCEKLASQIVAFLNGRGGRILIGVEDRDGAIVGLSPEQVRTTNQTIGNTTEDHVVPKVVVSTENVLTQDGVVIVLTVPEGIDKPYQTKRGDFYIRSGSDLKHVTHRDELRRLFQLGTHVYAERQVLSGIGLDRINLDLYREYYARRFKENAPESDEAVVEQMRSIGLVEESAPTLAVALLFAKDRHLSPQFSTKAIWFKGTDLAASGYVDERHIDGALPGMYKEAIAFLDAWNQRRQPSGATFNEQGIPIIPPEVFQEILTNAYIHRDYFIMDSNKIFIFDDRIEIHSPGTLPNSLTIQEATMGIRRIRNPLLDNIGPHLMEYKGAGSGLKRAKQLYPRIHFDNNFQRNAFIVTLPV